MEPTAITKGFLYIQDVASDINDSVESGSLLRALQESDAPTSAPNASPTTVVITLEGSIDDAPENSLVALFFATPGIRSCNRDNLAWTSPLTLSLPVENTSLYNSYTFSAEVPLDIVASGIGELQPGVIPNPKSNSKFDTVECNKLSLICLSSCAFLWWFISN